MELLGELLDEVFEVGIKHKIVVESSASGDQAEHFSLYANFLSYSIVSNSSGIRQINKIYSLMRIFSRIFSNSSGIRQIFFLQIFL